MDVWVAIGHRTDFASKRPTLIWVDDDWPVMVFVCQDTLSAVDARCTHQDQHLTEQDCFSKEAICPLHQARFDITTGKVTRGPAAGPLTVYPLRIDTDNTVWLQRVHPWWC